MIKLNEKFRGLVNGIKEVRRFGWVIMLLAGAVLMISAIAAKEGKLIRKIVTTVTPLAEGELLLTNEEVLKLLEISFTKPLDAIFLADVDVSRVESILEDHPLVADADAYVDADLELHVSVTQRNPLLRVIANNGQNYYLDDQGVRMPLSESYTARVLVASGNIVPWSNDYQERENHQLNDLFDLADLLRKDEFLDALVEQVYINNAGEMVLAPKVGDQVIFIGRYDEELTPARLARLKVFYEKGLPYEGWRKYKSFDLRYADQVVCKKT